MSHKQQKVFTYGENEQNKPKGESLNKLIN